MRASRHLHTTSCMQYAWRRDAACTHLLDNAPLVLHKLLNTSISTDSFQITAADSSLKVSNRIQTKTNYPTQRPNPISKIAFIPFGTHVLSAQYMHVLRITGHKKDSLRTKTCVKKWKKNYSGTPKMPLQYSLLSSHGYQP